MLYILKFQTKSTKEEILSKHIKHLQNPEYIYRHCSQLRVVVYNDDMTTSYWGVAKNVVLSYINQFWVQKAIEH